VYDKSEKYVLFQLMNDVEPLFASYETELSDYINEMDKDIKVKQEMAKEFDKIEWKDDITTMIPFDKLPDKLKEAYEEDADEAYRNMIEVLAYKITEKDLTPEAREQLMTMPFFLAVPEEMQESNYRYFSKKLNLITGLVTSMSEITNFKFGTLTACRNVEPHIRLMDKVDDAPCPVCGNTLKVITDIELPIMRITVETPSGERITAMIHADLWKPSESLSSQQQFLMFRVSETSPLKKIKNIQYLIIGTEKKQEFEVNVDDAKKVARRSTDDILSILTNSLFSDIAGNETLKRMAMLTLASINTQEIKIDYGNIKSSEIGIMNLLFWGREGTAKTRICRKAVSLVGTKLAFGQAGSSTITGLTAAYDKELKSVRMGAVPLNDTRCVLIDELDKFASRSDWTRLLEPAQERRITYNKAGIKATFNCRTALFFTANNRREIQVQQMDTLEQPEISIIEQIKNEIHRPLIDRMDLICGIQTVGVGQDILKSLLTTKCPEVYEENRIKNYFVDYSTD